MFKTNKTIDSVCSRLFHKPQKWKPWFHSSARAIIYISVFISNTTLCRFIYNIWKAPYLVAWNGRSPGKPQKIRKKGKEMLSVGWLLDWNFSHPKFWFHLLYCLYSFLVIFKLELVTVILHFFSFYQGFILYFISYISFLLLVD